MAPSGKRFIEGTFSSKEYGSYVGYGLGSGAEFGIILTDDWEVMNGLYTTHGFSFSESIVPKGADYITAFKGGEMIHGFSGNISIGLPGADVHNRIGLGKAIKESTSRYDFNWLKSTFSAALNGEKK